MDKTFEIKSSGVDVRDIMTKIRERIEQKTRAGIYDSYNLSGVIALELENFKTDDDYLNYYLRTIYRSANIDLGNFRIPSKTIFFGLGSVFLKRIIWNLLKFYTYRLFSQQKDFNSKIVGIVQGMNQKFDCRLADLEEKIEELSQPTEAKARPTKE